MANPENNKGLKRLIKATGYSMAGFRAAWKSEEAFRLEALLCLALTPVALWLADDGIEAALLIGSLILVAIVELLNSAIEMVVDRVGTEYHELSGRAKDIASAAVFLSLVNASVIWALVLLI